MSEERPGEAEAEEDDPSREREEGSPTLPYATPRSPVNYKTLRRMPSFEANLAAGKLEAAGIACFIADEHISAAHPLALSEVRLQVPEEDLERAAEVLAAPTAPAVSRDAAADDDEYVEEAYRCPRCHKKAVDLL